MGLFRQKVPITAITTHIDYATMTSHDHADDVTRVIAICDQINSTELGAKEARKAIQKKLITGDSAVQMLALSLLQQLSANCGPRFHAQLCAKSFIETLHNLAINSPDAQTKRRTLQFLGACESQLATNPSLAPIATLSRTLRDPTASFPYLSRTLRDPAYENTWSRNRKGFGGISARPIVVVDGSSLQRGTDEEESAPRGFGRPQRRRMTGSSSSTTESKKLTAEDLEQAKNKAQILTQALSFTDPEKEDITKNELIQEFYKTCKEQQEAISKYLTDADESGETDLLENLLVTNDELLSAFQIYNQMLQHADSKSRTNVLAPESNSTAGPTSIGESRTPPQIPRRAPAAPLQASATPLQAPLQLMQGPADMEWMDNLGARRQAYGNGGAVAVNAVSWSEASEFPQQQPRSEPISWVQQSPVLAPQESRSHSVDYSNTIVTPPSPKISTNPFHQRRLNISPSPPSSPSFSHIPSLTSTNIGLQSPPGSRPVSPGYTTAPLMRAASPTTTNPFDKLAHDRALAAYPHRQSASSAFNLGANLDLVPPPTIPIAGLSSYDAPVVSQPFVGHSYGAPVVSQPYVEQSYSAPAVSQPYGGQWAQPAMPVPGTGSETLNPNNPFASKRTSMHSSNPYHGLGY